MSAKRSKGGGAQGAKKRPATKKKRSATRKPAASKPKAPPPEPEPEPAGEPLRQRVERLWWAALAGVLVFVAFPYRAVPDSGLWPLAWVGLVPLLWAIRDVSPRRAFYLGWLQGTITNFGGFWWIYEVLHDFGHLPSPVSWAISGLNAGYQGLQFALFALLVAWLRRPSPFAIAACFVAVEYLFPMIFPWYLGNSQMPFPAATQVAELAGASGATFVVVLANAALFSAIHGRLGGGGVPRLRVGLAAIVVLASLGFGFVRMAQVDEAIAAADKVSIGMVEANIGIWEKEAKGLEPDQQVRVLHRNLLRHQAMSAAATAEGAEVIVWPESSYFPVGEVYGKRLDAFAVGVGPGPDLAVWRDLGRERGFSWSGGPAAGGRLRAVAASREDTVVAVGDGGRVVTWDGRATRDVPVVWPDAMARPALRGVAVYEQRGKGRARDGAPVTIWAVGDAGTVLRGDRGQLEPVTSGTPVHLRGIALATASKGIAVGDGGTVLALSRRRGVRKVKVDVTEDLHAVLADPDGAGFWAVGASGRVLRGDAVAWGPEATPTGAGTLRAVAGRSREGLIAVGDAGTVLRRDPDGTWRRETFPASSDLTAVTVDPFGVTLAADAAGGFWRRTATGEWVAEDAPGLGPLTGLAAMSWVRMLPIPRDTRYLIQSRAPLPSPEAFLADPEIEWRRPLSERTAVQRGFTTPVLFGAITWEPHPDPTDEQPRLHYNSAIMLDERGRIVGLYDKVFLLVFGEYIPFGERFPFLYDWIPEAGRFVPGTDVKTFDDGRHRYGVMVCYEDILPAFTGELAAQEPEVILNVTNDAWFGRTGEPYLHLALSAMRSVETRRALLRSTNTGVSAVIDPAGRLVAETRLDDPEILVHEVPMMSGTTVYGRVGDVFAYVLLLWVGAMAARRRFSSAPTRAPR